MRSTKRVWGSGPSQASTSSRIAVDHGQAPLDLAAEVGVAGGVDDVDLDAAVAHRGVLGQDGDALLPLEVAGVHDPVDHLLVGAERAGLAQHGVDQRRLAVVDVGHDGDVAEVFTDVVHGSLHVGVSSICERDGTRGNGDHGGLARHPKMPWALAERARSIPVTDCTGPGDPHVPSGPR